MSHFFVVVILPKGFFSGNVTEKIGELLAPYNEGLSVPSYSKECYCVGSIAKQVSRAEADMAYGSMDDHRKRFWTKERLERQQLSFKAKDEGEAERMGEELDKEWCEFISSWDRMRNQVFEKHPEKDKSKTDCGRCQGTGKYETGYNPKSKWDWWRMGGRWDGSICGEHRIDEKDKGFNFGSEHEDLGNNVQTVDFLYANEIIPFAIITPDGEWHERGDMGWWGLVADKKDRSSWRGIVLKIYEDHFGHLGVGCDLHI